MRRENLCGAQAAKWVRSRYAGIRSPSRVGLGLGWFCVFLRLRSKNTHRGRGRAPHAARPPTTHVAQAPGQVWCWDMTYLPAVVAGRWFYLILALYSRKIVGFEVHDRDDADHAALLVKRAALAEGIHAMARKPVLHGDNGATLKATTVLAMLHWLGIKPAYLRPRVCDDNAFAESLLCAAKYCAEFPATGFADLDSARQWAAAFVRRTNHDHRLGGIRYVSPAQRHAGGDHAFLQQRHALYCHACKRHPRRWFGNTRNWTPVGSVTLNPDRDTVVNAASAYSDKQPMAA